MSEIHFDFRSEFKSGCSQLVFHDKIADVKVSMGTWTGVWTPGLKFDFERQVPWSDPGQIPNSGETVLRIAFETAIGFLLRHERRDAMREAFESVSIEVLGYDLENLTGAAERIYNEGRLIGMEDMRRSLRHMLGITVL